MPLRTVRVPPSMAELFEEAERTVSSYFARRRDDPAHGTIEIFGERYLLVRAASLSVEFFSLVRNLYGEGREDEAIDFSRNILFDLAHALGKSDALRFHKLMGVDDPIVYRVEVRGAAAPAEDEDLVRRLDLFDIDEPITIEAPR